MISDNKILKIDPKRPQQELINKAARIIIDGGLVVFPAKCMYAIGANALDHKAISKIFEFKHRPKNKPILVLADDKTDGHAINSLEISLKGYKNNSVKYLVRSIPLKAEVLMDRFWPGDITFVLEAEKHLPSILTAGTEKIGIRVPQHPVARSLVKAALVPVTGTSANISGDGGCINIMDISEELLHKVDLVLDAGTLKGGNGSTIIDVTIEPFRILREGELSKCDIFSTLEQFNNFIDK